MAAQVSDYDRHKSEQVGRLLARRLREARKICGWLRCPVCLALFDGTHLVKCPQCRTLINPTFQMSNVPESSGKMELDFFLHP